MVYRTSPAPAGPDSAKDKPWCDGLAEALSEQYKAWAVSFRLHCSGSFWISYFLLSLRISLGSFQQELDVIVFLLSFVGDYTTTWPGVWPWHGSWHWDGPGSRTHLLCAAVANQLVLEFVGLQSWLSFNLCSASLTFRGYIIGCVTWYL